MTSPEPALRRELSLRDLVLFNVAAIVSTRWIGVAAHVGPGTLVLWLLAAALFLVPCAFVVADLSHRFPHLCLSRWGTARLCCRRVNVRATR